MKRNLVLLLVLSILLHPCLVSAKSLFGSGGTQVVYRGTVTGLRISALDGVAFLDNLPSAVTDLVTASPGVYGIEVYDSSGRMLKGVAKAVGTSETKAAAKGVTGITKANPGVATLNAGHGYANGFLTYLSGLTEMTSENTTYKTLTGNSGDTFQLGDLSGATAAETTGGNCIQAVTTPSTAGVTIVSAKGGTTYNWQSKNSSFTYNASSYYVVIKKLKGESIVKSGTGSGTTFVRGDFTSTNAFIEVVGVDLSAYVGTDAGSTPYKIRLFDSGGRIAEGYIGAGGAGESLGSERFRDATFDDTTKWTKGAGWAVSGGVATKTAGADSLLIDAGAGVSTVGQLIKRGIEISSVSAGVVYYPYDQTGSMLSYPTQSAGQYYKYWTSTNTAGVDSIYATALSDAVLLSASVKQVLDPPAATSGGLHITSANNGTTRNWKTVGSGFLYNSIASYQIIKE